MGAVLEAAGRRSPRAAAVEGDAADGLGPDGDRPGRLAYLSPPIQSESGPLLAGRADVVGAVRDHDLVDRVVGQGRQQARGSERDPNGGHAREQALCAVQGGDAVERGRALAVDLVDLVPAAPGDVVPAAGRAPAAAAHRADDGHLRAGGQRRLARPIRGRPRPDAHAVAGGLLVAHRVELPEQARRAVDVAHAEAAAHVLAVRDRDLVPAAPRGGRAGAGGAPAAARRPCRRPRP